jgi:DNA-binding transcriptional LysR family regulator
MDTYLLKTFMEVVEQRHFGKAAANLYVTQSAVSARIRLLEQEVGRPLFVRQRNNIHLTKYGEKLVSHAKDILHA